MVTTVKTGSVLLLSGDYETNTPAPDHIVVFCPLRYLSLIEKGVKAHLFGDFSPSEPEGGLLDGSLHERLDDCLHREDEGNDRLKWAPVAIQHVKWRLSRYLWLKECVRKIIVLFRPGLMVLSSDRDEDISRAVSSVAAEQGIDVQIGNGGMDQSTSVLYLCAPFALPRKLDPGWFVNLRWRFIRLFGRNIETLYEPYHKLDAYFAGGPYKRFPLATALGFLARLKSKLFASGKTDEEVRKANTMVDFPLNLAVPVIISERLWGSFADDEIVMINALLYEFYRRYAQDLLYKMERNLSLILSIIKPQRIILLADQVDACRFIARVAHKMGVEVDNLLHGIAIEDYSGRRRGSPYSPDRMLAWNNSSRDAYLRLGWRAVSVRHPSLQSAPKRFRPFAKKWSSMKVLVLTSDWVIVTQAGREDCAVSDMTAILTALKDLGVSGNNIGIKCKPTSIEKAYKIKRDAVEKLREYLSLDFRVLSNDRPTPEILAEYDLVITPLTTAIFEAVFSGTPLVVFGLSCERVGALDGFRLPHAKTADDLARVLREYDGMNVEKIYDNITVQFQSGSDIAAIPTATKKEK